MSPTVERNPDTIMQEASLNNALLPILNVQSQHTRHLSFEGFTTLDGKLTAPPKIEIQVHVDAKPLKDPVFEVELAIEAKAAMGTTPIFNLELSYIGIFRIENIPAESLRLFIMVECPRILFPFAREIVSDTVRRGGFPPLMIDPVDFVGLYNKKEAT